MQIPNMESVLLRSVRTHNGSWAVIGALLIVIMLSGFGHMITFYRLLGSVGAVSTGNVVGSCVHLEESSVRVCESVCVRTTAHK